MTYKYVPLSVAETANERCARFADDLIENVARPFEMGVDYGDVVVTFMGQMSIVIEDEGRHVCTRRPSGESVNPWRVHTNPSVADIAPLFCAVTDKQKILDYMLRVAFSTDYVEPPDANVSAFFGEPIDTFDLKEIVRMAHKCSDGSLGGEFQRMCIRIVEEWPSGSLSKRAQ